LDNIGKKITLEQFRKFSKAAKKANVLVHGCFMAGNPGETHESLQKTLDLAKQLNPDTAQFFPIMVYPGTKAYEWAQNNHYMTTADFSEWLTPDGLHKSIVSQPGLSAEELVAWCDNARRSFYLRPSYIARKIWEMVTHPKEIGRIFKAGRVFAKFLIHPSLPKDQTPPEAT